MALPGEDDLRAERHAVVATMASLTDDEFESGPTLCTEWAPRDVLAHLIGVDSGLFEYVKAPGRIDQGNQAVVDKARAMTRERLMHRAEHWADKPAPLSRLGALFFLGDLSIHHQDVLRGLGRTRDVPDHIRAAILRGGMGLGARRLLSHRVAPTDGGRSLGRGTVVRGTSEALGMWLAGRAGIEPELEFSS
jgi:uncharacterized protein (TIGR03083 family)